MYDLAINEIHSMASLRGESNLFAIRDTSRIDHFRRPPATLPSTWLRSRRSNGSVAWESLKVAANPPDRLYS